MFTKASISPNKQIQSSGTSKCKAVEQANAKQRNRQIQSSGTGKCKAVEQANTKQWKSQIQSSGTGKCKAVQVMYITDIGGCKTG